MKILTNVISLKTEELRRLQISKQLKQFSIPFVFFDAIDYRNTDHSIVKKIVIHDDVFNKPSRELTKGEIGCAVSHLTLISTFQNYNSYDAFLVLEDDAIITDEFHNFISSPALKNNDWDVIILGYSKLLKSEYEKFYIKEPIKTIFKVGGIEVGKIWKEWTCGTVGYLINKKCLWKFSNLNVSTVADDWLYFRKKIELSIYHVRPLLIEENFLELESSIEKERSVFFKKNRRYLDVLRMLRGYYRKLVMNKLFIK